MTAGNAASLVGDGLRRPSDLCVDRRRRASFGAVDRRNNSDGGGGERKGGISFGSWAGVDASRSW